MPFELMIPKLLVPSIHSLSLSRLMLRVLANLFLFNHTCDFDQ